MIAFIAFLTLLLLGVAQILSRRPDMRRLNIVFDADTKLLEPGELATLRYTVSNSGPLPVLCASLALLLDEGVTVADDERLKGRVSRNFAGTRIDHRFYLLPGRKFSGVLHFTVSRRGLYELGRYYLETGDLLGLKPLMRSDSLGIKLICTAAQHSAEVNDVLGGELGEISVRRFIMDDPCILMGYREYSGREPMKQISWKQSAKVGRFMVRQNDFTSDHIAVVIVNMDQSRPAMMEGSLSTLRSVCEKLEEARIPYELMSNGDLFSLPEGLGRAHLFFVLRRIGLSRLTGYTSFRSLIERCVRLRRSDRSYIVVTPVLSEEVMGSVAVLRRFADHDPIVLEG